MPFPFELQPSKYQHVYKRSYYFKDAYANDIEQIEDALQGEEIDVNVVYSGDQYLDILPKWANKGNALTWLIKHLGFKKEETLVAGDSGNDIAMFNLNKVKGIAVGNAREELYKVSKYLPVYHAEKIRDKGVVEGLVYYGILPEEANQEVDLDNPTSEGHFIQAQVSHPDISKEKLALIDEGYDKAVISLKKSISHLGFLACSIDGNESVGTDENYRSIWARDGAISIIGAMPLIKDQEIKDAIITTLKTILDNVSVNGQVPSNISIKDGHPDYSGVGGICSIDSGLWLIIAVYEYVYQMDDFDFLYEYKDVLQKVMDWLSAQDGNNDALIEVPEAGDWTDLFGRSYHVLYDEVLWYRTNVCYGRLLEMIGDYENAGGYIRWSQVIKKEILANFWPSTQQSLFQSVSFAEQQFSLGDTKYLVAQITPFDYSWRCDVLGNVLAYLYNVIDHHKANSAFKFMLGVGVNDPYPVKNVYPVVSPGDPDWRPYYTVNLLNLPNHYHNGGIWPFIGGLWVQFIKRLGQDELAISEMYKLAELNKLGLQNDWEFNEWVHGTTGNPMGKINQAWSAAQYIAAYHALNLNKRK